MKTMPQHRTRPTTSYTLDPDSLEYIAELAEREGMTRSQALERIIDDHRSGTGALAGRSSDAERQLARGVMSLIRRLGWKPRDAGA